MRTGRSTVTSTNTARFYRAACNARYAYVYAIALNSTGARADAAAVLERTHREHPADREALVASVSIARDQGDFATALRHARELLILDPQDPQLGALIAELERNANPDQRCAAL
jgi:Flp pilus assembly protein TadD